MNKKDIVQLKKALVLEKEEIINRMQAERVEVDADGDDTDEIQAKMIVLAEKSIANRDVVRLNQINKALDKMKNGDFGSCEECGEEIAIKRLMINPSFVNCILCAEKQERSRRFA